MTLAEAPDVKRNLLDNPSLEPVQEPHKEFYSDSEGLAQEYRGEYPRGAQSQWRQGELRFTTAAGATRCVAAFGAPRQMDGEFTWIDDVSLVKVYDPVHFKK
jgi:hypothetical protein